MPSFFSVGESAKKQQKEFEAKDKLVFNSFKTTGKVDKRTAAPVDLKKKPTVVVGVKRNFTNKSSPAVPSKPTLPGRKK